MNAVNRIEEMFASGLKISVAFGNPPVILTDRAPLERILEYTLRTLCRKEKTSELITITTYQVSIEEEEHPTLSTGTYAKLCISEESRFTNSSQTLSMVDSSSEEFTRFARAARLCEEIGGRMLVEQFNDGGYLVSLLFRVPDRPLSHLPPPEVVKETGTRPRVLLIDDDMMVLETVQRLLINAGINCVAAEDSHKALTLAREHKESIKVVLLDALMPGMNGSHVLRKLKAIEPNFKVIGFSGAPPEITRTLLEGGAVRILRKPVEPMNLRDAITQLLDSKDEAQVA